MAKRSKDENQGSLFDITPVKKLKMPINSVKFVPMKKEVVMMVIHYKDNKEVAHASVPLSQVDSHKNFNVNFAKEKGYKKTFKVLGWDDYWEKWYAGKLKLGH